MTADGLKAIKGAVEGILRTALIFSANQALLAIRAGIRMSARFGASR